MRGDIFQILRSILKARSMSYAELAARMELSEPTIKRIFAQQDCKLERLLEICEILEVPLTDVLHRAGRVRGRTVKLPVRVEARLAAQPSLFHIFVLLREGIPQHVIEEHYGLSSADMFRLGQELEALGLAQLYPCDRIKITVLEPIEYRLDGPLTSLMKAINLKFLDQAISNPSDQRRFFTISRRMLPDTAAFISREIDELRATIAELARQDQMVSNDEDLMTYKLAGAWGQASYPDLLKIESET